MSAAHHIRNPFEMAVEQFSSAASDAARVDLQPHAASADAPLAVRRIDAHDLWAALRGGFNDFAAARDDVIFIAVIYPIAGLVLAQMVLNHNLLPLLFPLASGFALLGPAAAVGLYEISRRRERGARAGWADAFGVIRSPAIGSIFALGLLLLTVFLFWLGSAGALYNATLGPAPPASLGAFAQATFGTAAGWTMIVAGGAIGFVFAVIALAISVVSFPLLLDRGGGVGRAVATSIRAVRANPGPMALWGLIVAVALVLGSGPALVGLIVVMPVLGHATWRLYRKLVAEA